MGEPKPLTAYQQTYHWRNKNCAPWAYEWVKSSLPGLKLGGAGQETVQITEVSSVSGDCDLGQRKGKILTIYDLEVELKWTGTAKDGSEVKGSLKIPEMSHETIDGLSDYVYDFSVSSPSAGSSELLAYIKSAFPPILTEKLNEFRPALLAAHGNSSASSETPSASASGTSTPAAGGSYSPAPPAKEEKAPPPKEENKTASVGNTVSVEVKADLQASADDLWQLLTDENKIPMWSRSSAKLSLTADTPYELFGGNVRGKVVSVDKPNKLVQTWQVRNPQWPTEHYGTLSIVLAQGSDSTSVTFTLDGVPSGQATDVEHALDTFYIRGLKQMGLVSSSSSRSFLTPTRTPASKPKPKRLKKKTITAQGWTSSSTLLGGAVLVALSAVLGGIVYSSFPSSSPSFSSSSSS